MTDDEIPDLIVLRHSPDMPHHMWDHELEGRWVDLRDVPKTTDDGPRAAQAVATGRFEYRQDGAIAEVYEISLTGWAPCETT